MFKSFLFIKKVETNFHVYQYHYIKTRSTNLGRAVIRVIKAAKVIKVIEIMKITVSTYIFL